MKKVFIACPRHLFSKAQTIVSLIKDTREFDVVYAQSNILQDSGSINKLIVSSITSADRFIFCMGNYELGEPVYTIKEVILALAVADINPEYIVIPVKLTEYAMLPDYLAKLNFTKVIDFSRKDYYAENKSELLSLLK